MHWMIRLIVPALLMGTATASELATLTRPDTNFLLGVRVSEIRESPLLEMALAQVGGPDLDFVGLPEGNAEALLQHVDEVLIAGRVDQSGQSAEDEAVILVRGNFAAFDPAREICREGCDVESHREIGLYKSHRATPEDESPDYMALLDNRYMALGKRSAVTEVIDRFVWKSPSAHTEEMANWQGRIGGAHVWLIASGPFGGVSADAEGPSAAVLEALNRVHALGFGLDFADDLQASLEIRAGSQSDARDVFDMVNGMVALARLAEAGNSEWQPSLGALQSLLDELEVRHEGRVVRASLVVAQADIKRAIHGGPDDNAPHPASQPTMISGTSTGRGQASGEIRIYGLESGTHSVEIKRSRRQR